MVLSHRGYTAWVESGGVPLEEYGCNTQGKVISCYVCSEEGKEFVIHFSYDRSYRFKRGKAYGRTIDLQMDGSTVDTLWGEAWEDLESKGMDADNAFRSYTFTPVATTDDDNVADDANVENIGTIQAELKRATRNGYAKAKGGPKGTGLNTGPVHERSKKAGSHRVGLGEGVYRRPGTTVIKVKYKDRTPWVIFRFLYRKRDILQANDIIPRSPAPSPPPDNLPGPSTRVEGGGFNEFLQGMSTAPGTLQDELKRLHAIWTARQEAKNPVKQEAGSSTNSVIDLT